MRLFPLLLAAFFALACASPAYAAASDKLKAVEKQLDAQKQQKEQLDAQARKASAGLNDLRARLIGATRRLQDKEAEEETLEDRQDDLAGEIAAKSKDAAAERARLAQMVSALIEIAGRPPETLFLQKGATEAYIHRSILLRDLLPRLRDEAQSAARDLATLYDLQKQLARQKKLVAAAQDNLRGQQQNLDQLIDARQGALQRTEAQKEEIAKHLADLSSQAKDLRQLMEKVAPAPKHAERALPAGKGGALLWPVSGNVVKRFGQKDADGVTSEGLTLAAPSGAPVVAPRAGRVAFAGPFRGYGNIVILQHANGYYTFLSGFGRIDADLGQDVEAGEPLGVLPVKPGTKPDLYFEWRRGGSPEDPMPQLR